MLPTAKFMFLNGKIVPYEDCRIHAFSALAKYGTGVFEGLRGYWNPDRNDLYVFRLREHLLRLQFGMKVMRFDGIPSLQYLEDGVLDMLRANDLRQTAHIRLIAFVEEDGEMYATGPVGVVCGAIPRPQSPKVTDGVNLAVSSWSRLSDNVMPPRVKAVGNYVNNRAAELGARVDGYDGALLLTREGKVAEGSGACLFLMRDGRVVTPDVTSDILESITRDTMIQLFREKAGITVQERKVDRTELYAADELFWCGSGYEVQPIISVDRLPVGSGKPGQITRTMQKHYFDLVHGRSDEHPEWRTPLYGNDRGAAA